MNTRDPAASAVKELTHFIGGKHVAGRDAKSGGRFGDVFNPTLGKLSAKAPLASKTEVEAAIAPRMAIASQEFARSSSPPPPWRS